LRTFSTILILAALLAGSLGFAQSAEHTVLILPFENVSKAPGLEWISEAFPETLGDGIESAEVYIIPRDDRNTAFDRMGVPVGAHLSRATLYRISEQIGADYLVLGKYDYDGKSFTATAQLLDMKKLYLAPEVRESGPLLNMVDVQRALAWDLLRALSPDTLPGKQNFLQAMAAIRLDAFENFVRGEVATNRAEKIQRFREAVRLNPRYTQAMLQLGKTYFANREYESAASWFARVPADDTLSGQASFYRGLSCYYFGDYDCAESAFTFLEAEFPLPEVVNNLGVVMGRRGKRDEIEYLQKAVNSDPSQPDYHFNLAVGYARIFDNAHAIRELKETLRLRPSDAEAKTFLETLNGTPAAGSVRPASSSAGKLPLQRISRNYDETSYRQLALEIERAGEARLTKDDPQQHASFHVQRGQQLLSQGFNADAAKAFEEAITYDPTNAAAHAGLAQADAAIGREKEALAEANAALRLQPSADAYLILARQNLKDDKLSAAGEEVDRALELDPRNQTAQDLKRTIDEKLAANRN
jgi:tetratricopeptide (TPR) repeat protein